MSRGAAGRAAIIGIGATEFSKNSGRTPMELAVESCEAALADAGLPADKVCLLYTSPSPRDVEE